MEFRPVWCFLCEITLSVTNPPRYPKPEKKTLEIENPIENQNLLMVSQEGCHSHKRQPSETKLARKSTVLFLS